MNRRYIPDIDLDDAPDLSCGCMWVLNLIPDAVEGVFVDMNLFLVHFPGRVFPDRRVSSLRATIRSGLGGRI